MWRCRVNNAMQKMVTRSALLGKRKQTESKENCTEAGLGHCISTIQCIGREGSRKLSNFFPF